MTRSKESIVGKELTSSKERKVDRGLTRSKESIVGKELTSSKREK